MTRGALRFTEEQYRAHAAKSDRFKVGTDQRAAARKDGQNGDTDELRRTVLEPLNPTATSISGGVESNRLTPRKIGNPRSSTDHGAGVKPGPLTLNRPAAVTPAAPPPASGGASQSFARQCIAAQVKREMAPVNEAIRKYRNKPTDGYASKREASRAFQLKLMQEAGQIRNLREQVSYLLIPKQEGERACSYVADFVYEEYRIDEQRITKQGDEWASAWWATVVEDCKGMKTDVYRLKRKLMKFVHGISIRET